MHALKSISFIQKASLMLTSIFKIKTDEVKAETNWNIVERKLFQHMLI